MNSGCWLTCAKYENARKIAAARSDTKPGILYGCAHGKSKRRVTERGNPRRANAMVPLLPVPQPRPPWLRRPHFDTFRHGGCTLSAQYALWRRLPAIASSSCGSATDTTEAKSIALGGRCEYGSGPLSPPCRDRARKWPGVLLGARDLQPGSGHRPRRSCWEARPMSH